MRLLVGRVAMSIALLGIGLTLVVGCSPKKPPRQPVATQKATR